MAASKTEQQPRPPSLSRTPSMQSVAASLEAGGIAIDEIKGDAKPGGIAAEADTSAGGDEKAEHSAPDEQKEGKFVMTDQTLFLPTGRLLIVLAAASTCIFLSFLDQTIVATALPLISSYFASGTESSWVATAYLVASTASQPIYGRLSDIFGRKQVLLGVVAMFSVFSLACAVAQTMIQLSESRNPVKTRARTDACPSIRSHLPCLPGLVGRRIIDCGHDCNERSHPSERSRQISRYHRSHDSLGQRYWTRARGCLCGEGLLAVGS